MVKQTRIKITTLSCCGIKFDILMSVPTITLELQACLSQRLLDSFPLSHTLLIALSQIFLHLFLINLLLVSLFLCSILSLINMNPHRILLLEELLPLVSFLNPIIFIGLNQFFSDIVLFHMVFLNIFSVGFLYFL